MTPSLLRLGRRYLFRRPLQSVLVILGIALGVAVVIAVDLANGSASRAFRLSTEAISGRATHQIVGGPSGVPEALYARLRRELGLPFVAPVVSEYVFARDLAGRPMRLVGIDPFSDAPFRSYLGASDAPLSLDQLTGFLTQPQSVLLSKEVAENNGVEVGEQIRLGIGSREAQVTVIGLLAPSDELSRRALDSLLVADIATAQELLEREGSLSTIDLILPEGEAGEAEAVLVEAVLPPGIQLERPATRTSTIEQMSAAFELNLTALSLLALVVGMFLIYNTVTFSVVQRRAVIGTLRAIGVTRREIFGLILSEAAFLGLLGAFFGMLLGLFLGRGVVRLVTQTINDLYFVVNVEGIDVAPLTLLKGAFLGITAAVLAAIPPAWEAAGVAPMIALRRSTVESRILRLLPSLSVVAVVLALIGIVLLFVSSRSIVLPFLALFAIVLAFAGLTPVITIGLMKVIAKPMARLGILGRMATRDLVRALSRTSVAIAALMVAVSVIIGVGIMISSFRNTVIDWLNATLQADIYISAPRLTANRVTASLDPVIAEQVAGIEGITRIAVIRDVAVSSPDLGRVQLIAVKDEVGMERPFKWLQGEPVDALRLTKQRRGVLVSEPFAYRHQIEPDDSITLTTDRGEQSFPVLGVYYDYSSDRGVVLMDNSLYRELYDDDRISSIAAYVSPDKDVDEMVNQLRLFFARQEQALIIGSNAGLRASVLEVFERAFAITGALQILATIVAFIGVLSALMALQLERARELGTLRAVGMSQRQLWGLTMLETGLMGSTAGLWAMPTGLALALILIYVINLRSFGWTLQLQLTPFDFFEAFMVALIASLLAGAYPAIRMSQIRISRALRSE